MKREKYIALIGNGSVANAFALAFKKAKQKIILIGRNETKIKNNAKKLRVEYSTLVRWVPATECQSIIIAVSDDAIESVVQILWKKANSLKGCTIFHTSGALTSDILQPLAMLGAHVASFHPMQTILHQQVADRALNSCWIALEGDAKAVSAGKKLATKLCVQSFVIDKEAKTFYHLAAVFASNYLTTILSVSRYLAREAKIPEGRYWNIFLPIILRTLQNVIEYSPKKALTGPIVRGDVRTVEKHLRILSKKNLQHLVPLYSSLGVETARLAHDKHAR